MPQMGPPESLLQPVRHEPLYASFDLDLNKWHMDGNVCRSMLHARSVAREEHNVVVFTKWKHKFN